MNAKDHTVYQTFQREISFLLRTHIIPMMECLKHTIENGCEVPGITYRSKAGYASYDCLIHPKDGKGTVFLWNKNRVLLVALSDIVGMKTLISNLNTNPYTINQVCPILLHSELNSKEWYTRTCDSEVEKNLAGFNRAYLDLIDPPMKAIPIPEVEPRFTV